MRLNFRAGSEKQLKLEETIAAALNQQALARKEFEDRLKTEAEERAFNRFLYGSISSPPEVIQQQIERSTRKLAEQLAEQNQERKTS